MKQINAGRELALQYPRVVSDRDGAGDVASQSVPLSFLKRPLSFSFIILWNQELLEQNSLVRAIMESKTNLCNVPYDTVEVLIATTNQSSAAQTLSSCTKANSFVSWSVLPLREGPCVPLSILADKAQGGTFFLAAASAPRVLGLI